MSNVSVFEPGATAVDPSLAQPSSPTAIAVAVAADIPPRQSAGLETQL